MDDITTNSFPHQNGTKLCKNKYLKRWMRQTVLSFVRFYIHNKIIAAAFAVKQHFLQKDEEWSECLHRTAVELEKIISSGGRWVDDLCVHVVLDELLCNCNYDPHWRGLEGMYQPLSKLSPAPAISLHMKQKVWRIPSFVSVTQVFACVEIVPHFLLFITLSARPTCLILPLNEALRLYLIFGDLDSNWSFLGISNQHTDSHYRVLKGESKLRMVIKHTSWFPIRISMKSVNYGSFCVS